MVKKHLKFNLFIKKSTNSTMQLTEEEQISLEEAEENLKNFLEYKYQQLK